MSIFRSDDMYLYKVVLEKDNEKAIMQILGDRNLAHFINMNAHEQVFGLPYVEMIKSCEETDRKLQYLIERCDHLYIKLQPAETIEEMQHLLREMAASKGMNRDLLLDEIQKEVQKVEEFMKEQNSKAETLNKEANNLIENYNVIKKAGYMIYGQADIDSAIKNEFENGSPKGNSSDEMIESATKVVGKLHLINTFQLLIKASQEKSKLRRVNQKRIW